MILSNRSVPILQALLLVSASPILAQGEWFQVREILPADITGGDVFGNAMALDGDLLVVGAWRDDSQFHADDGSVTLFERNRGGPDQWGQVAKFIAPDGEPDWNLGSTVAVAGEVVVGATPIATFGVDNGAAYVYEPAPSGRWRPTAKLTAPDQDDNGFGSSVAATGEEIFVGAELDSDAGPLLSGAVYVFGRDPEGGWVLTDKLLPAETTGDARFGDAVAVRGDVLLVGARRDSTAASTAGAAHVFERDAGGKWVETAKLFASDPGISECFGWSAAVGDDLLVVGAPDDSDLGNNAGAAYVYEQQPDGTWPEIQKLLPSDGDVGWQFGFSVSVSGTKLAIGAPRLDLDVTDVGAVYVFDRRSDGFFAETAQLFLDEPETGDTLAEGVALDAATLFASAPRRKTAMGNEAGAAYEFRFLDLAFEASGTCPGEVTLTFSGGTAEAAAALAFADASGETPVDAGPCPGVVLDLDDPRPVDVIPTDGEGAFTVARTVGAGACGKLLQAVDLATCVPGPVATLPGGASRR